MATANDIYKGLHYGFGHKNASVGVIEYDNSATILSASKIQKISQYHSFQFSDAGIQMCTFKLVKVKIFFLDHLSSPVRWGKDYHTVKLIKECNRVISY